MKPRLTRSLETAMFMRLSVRLPVPAFEALKYEETLFLPILGTFTKEPIGFALRKGDFDTLAFFNSWITGVRHEGWLDERHHYWFETRDWSKLI